MNDLRKFCKRFGTFHTRLVIDKNTSLWQNILMFILVKHFSYFIKTLYRENSKMKLIGFLNLILGICTFIAHMERSEWVPALLATWTTLVIILCIYSYWSQGDRRKFARETLNFQFTILLVYFVYLVSVGIPMAVSGATMGPHLQELRTFLEHSMWSMEAMQHLNLLTVILIILALWKILWSSIAAIKGMQEKKHHFPLTISFFNLKK